jgi:hypothetical protein
MRNENRRDFFRQKWKVKMEINLKWNYVNRNRNGVTRMELELEVGFVFEVKLLLSSQV